MNIYKVVSMNKLGKSSTIQATIGKEALEILVKANVKDVSEAVYSESDRYVMVEFYGYKFMTTKTV